MRLGGWMAIGVGVATTVAAMAQQAPPPVDHDPTKVEAGTYAADPEHTQASFGVLHLGFSNYFGRFAHPTGTLTLDPKAPAASKLEISVPTDSVSTTSAKLDEELKSADWLDAGKYPTMTFRSTKVVAKGKGAAEVTGDLTLHGVTKPVTLTVEFVGAGPNPLSKKYTVGFSAVGSIQRSEFGVTKYVPLIGDKVDLWLNGSFEKQ